MTIKIRTKGLKELDKALKEFPKKVQRRGLNKSLKAGAKVVAKQVKATAPVDTGAIRRNVQARNQPRNKRTGKFAGVINVGVVHGRIRIQEVGKTRKGFVRKRGGGLKLRRLSSRERRREDPYYVRFQERGYTAVGSRKIKGGAVRRAATRRARISAGKARKIPGKNFIRNALRTKSTQALNAIRDELRKFVEKQRGKK